MAGRLLYRDIVVWGLALWFYGYVLGFVFFILVAPSKVGWFVMPLGVLATLVVLWKWARPASLRDAIVLGLGWAAIAVAADYVFIVKLLHPARYYRTDVYLYYLLTLLLPPIVAAIRPGVRR